MRIRTRMVRRLALWLMLGLIPLVGHSATYPEPEAVVAGFYVNSQQFAALHVLETVIAEKAQPQSPEVKTLLERYRAAMTELRARNANRPDFLMELADYLQRESFRTDVLHRYLPEYENASITAFKQRAEFQPRKKGPDTNLMVAATALLMLLVPLIYLIRGERLGSAQAVVRHVDGRPPGKFELPESLAMVKLLRLRLYLDHECGRIHDDKVETVVTKHKYTRTTHYDNGHVSTQDAGSTTTSVTYHTLSLTSPDGREWRQMFVEDEFPAAVGDVIGVISSGDHAMYAFNHTRGTFVALHGGVGQALRMRAGRGLWLTTIGVAAAGAAITMLALGGEQMWRAFWAVVIVFGVLSLVYIVILKMVVQIFRRMPFRVMWRPRLKKFMQEQTPLLNRFYSQQ